LQMYEVQVFSGGSNVALNQVATQSSTLLAYRFFGTNSLVAG
jgi:hypothetical protein